MSRIRPGMQQADADADADADAASGHVDIYLNEMS